MPTNSKEKGNDVPSKDKAEDRFLKNNGSLSTLVIHNQAAVGYYNKKGDFIEIKIVMSRHGQEKQAKSLALPDTQKALFYYRNGKFESEVRKQIEHSFEITSYPHIIRFPVGRSTRDERLYTIKVNQVAKMQIPSDADTLMKQYHFLDEVDSKGDVVQENKWRLAESDKKVDTSKFPTAFNEVPTDRAPRQESVDKRVTSFSEDEDVKEK